MGTDFITRNCIRAPREGEAPPEPSSISPPRPVLRERAGVRVHALLLAPTLAVLVRHLLPYLLYQRPNVRHRFFIRLITIMRPPTPLEEQARPKVRQRLMTLLVRNRRTGLSRPMRLVTIERQRK